MQQYPSKPILIIDDEKDVLESYQATLRLNKINNMLLCSDSRKVMDILEEHTVSVIVLDLFMPHITGQDLLDNIKVKYPNIPIVVVTASDSIDHAVDCMKMGAYDYVRKPVEEARLITLVRNALLLYDLQQENKSLSKQVLQGMLNSRDEFSNIITCSRKMLSIFNYIEAIAISPKPILITGESGVGKELIAKAIHKASKRKGQFIPVNIGGLDDSMFSDTLFGHTKGAFTSASTIRKGLVEQAAEGTLFLDEIGTLDEASQIKLLRLLQENEYYQLGADLTSVSSASVICATNENLRKRAFDGTFRNDLFYRLATHHIKVPPLRERIEDIPLLFDYFVQEAAESFNKKPPTFSNDLLSALSQYDFPGNIRELQSLIYDAVGQCSTQTLNKNLFNECISSSPKRQSKFISDPAKNFQINYFGEFPTLDNIKNYFITEAMQQSNGNQTMAAQLLGISQSTLSRMYKSNFVVE